jgi:ribosome assembly protein RRB1
VWRPGIDPVAEDEELDYDPTAYDCLHKFTLEWPCLSFDVIPDTLGAPRSTFPHELFMVAGTQAAQPRQNYLAVLRLASLGQGRHGKKADKADKDSDSESDDDESDDESMSGSEDEDDKEPPARMHHRYVPSGLGLAHKPWRQLSKQPQEILCCSSYSDLGCKRMQPRCRCPAVPCCSFLDMGYGSLL